MSGHKVDHYKSTNGGCEPIDLIMSLDLSFLEGNVVKYVCRYKRKDGIKDLIKAQQYLNWLIEIEQDREVK